MPHSPLPVLNVITSIHLTRVPPKPESPPESDERDRPSQHSGSTRTHSSVVGVALWYYKGVAEDNVDGEGEGEDEEDVVDIPHGSKEERGETDGRTRSKRMTDWKTNPRAKPGR